MLVMCLYKGWVCRHGYKLWHRDLLWLHEVPFVIKASSDNLHILKFISYPEEKGYDFKRFIETC